MINIQQVKSDFENDVLICRATIKQVIDLAILAQPVTIDLRMAAQAVVDAIRVDKDCVRGYQLDALDAALKAMPPPAVPNTHQDDFAVDLFAAAMKSKMAAGRARGRSGWNDPMLCSGDSLRRLLAESIAKGDPVDVGNFAMMLFNRDART